jgi:hypothetical protein
MTDEELAVLILETRDNEPDPAWVPGDDEEGAWRNLPRVREVWTRIARRVRDRLEANKREQTAATILAATLRNARDTIKSMNPLIMMGLADDDREQLEAKVRAECVKTAVELTDALRAELAKGKP